MNIPPFRLERYFAKYEFHVPYLLCGSDCESFSVRELLEMEAGAFGDFRKLRLGYTESTGSPDLRKAIAALYKNIHPDQILVHAGAEEAIFIFMNTMLQPGDHVIVHYPCYQSLCDVAQSIGCQVTKWITGEADGWELDLEFLKDNLRSNTKAVIINCPHNPTGYLMTKDKQAAINDLATDHGFILCSDEVYRFLEYRDEDRLPAMCDLNDQAVSLGVMSKSFGLAGLRIGWIATKNEAVYQRMASFKDYTTICNSAPSEFLATLALRNKERLLNRNRQIIARNLEVLNRFFARYQDRFHWQPPKAGPIAFPSLANGADAETFCHELVTKAGVLLLPGPAFDDSYPRNFRIGFGRKNLPECLEKFEEFLEKQG